VGRVDVARVGKADGHVVQRREVHSTREAHKSAAEKHHTHVASQFYKLLDPGGSYKVKDPRQNPEYENHVERHKSMHQPRKKLSEEALQGAQSWPAQWATVRLTARFV
jgi:hypothetical protein